ncbi:MAG: Asp-tRNA(Asn)/Glu-tRNA(Gln) amidotransferase subunit GatC [Candidatus Nomurabacteria bacterium]|nr:Asp-tRNA(Asn)/Glu-tRNA(Gln) amidotransferase subunit GatC [Candidatus Nomurabacteria bacterium]
MQLEDIKKLADLARIDMSEEEMVKIAKDFDPILAYVGQVQEALKLSEEISADKKPEDYFLHNVMREDIVTNTRAEYTEKITAEMPDTQDGFLKVKQIL